MGLITELCLLPNSGNSLFMLLAGIFQKQIRTFARLASCSYYKINVFTNIELITQDFNNFSYFEHSIQISIIKSITKLTIGPILITILKQTAFKPFVEYEHRKIEIYSTKGNYLISVSYEHISQNLNLM
jgi:hypothetical protein